MVYMSIKDKKTEHPKHNCEDHLKEVWRMDLLNEDWEFWFDLCEICGKEIHY